LGQADEGLRQFRGDQAAAGLAESGQVGWTGLRQCVEGEGEQGSFADDGVVFGEVERADVVQEVVARRGR
jgi:hypothetical protein